MKTLKWNKNLEIKTGDLRRVGDISYYEGPLLVLYENIHNNHLYFVDWVDRDESVNRWLVYKVLPRIALKYITKGLSLAQMIAEIARGSFYAVDIHHNSTLNDSNIYNIEEVPESYLPDPDIYFEQEECRQFEFIKNYIIDVLGNAKRENSFDSKMLEHYDNNIKSDAHLALNYISILNLQGRFQAQFQILEISEPRLKKISSLHERFEYFRNHVPSNNLIQIVSLLSKYNYEENSLEEIVDHRFRNYQSK